MSLLLIVYLTNEPPFLTPVCKVRQTQDTWLKQSSSEWGLLPGRKTSIQPWA